MLEDVDKDGDIEVAIGVEDKVLIWDLAGAYDEANIEWKMFHHDLWHTGLYDFSPSNLPPFVRDVEASPGYVAPGSDVIITAKVSDEDSVSSVTADIESPDETVRGTITLYDDGAHNDGAAGDGTYGNTWTTLVTKLDYVVDVTAVDSLSNSCIHDNVASFTTQDVACVQYDTYTINSDNINYDGTPNPGEYVQFSITLENIGVLNAPGVTATISTVDPYIWYYDTGAAGFGDIAAGGTATCSSYDYYFRVSNTCPHNHMVRFNLNVGDSNGNTWSDHFDVTIIDNVGPAISWADASPRYTVAGEQVAIVAYYVEDGSGISSVQAVIESPDETAVITVTLHDDGAHDDGGAGDGTYGNTWTTDVTQRDYYVDFTTEDGLGNVRDYDNMTMFTTKAFSKTADILLVPDYGGNNTDWFQFYYTNALDDLGYAYDMWDTEWREAPDSATLNLYTDGVVIWTVPYWGYFDDWDVRPDIEAYLDAGGNLFMTGQDVAQDLNGTMLLNDYLHAIYVQDRTYLYTLNGTAGDPIGDGLVLGISGGDGADNQYDTDEVAPISPAVTVLTYDPSGTGGLRVDTGTYKAVYFAFGFEGINSAVDRAMVMGRVLNWLGAVPSVLSRDLSIQESLISGRPEPDGTLTYGLAYANLGNLSANDVWITDTLPAGIVYVSSAGPVVPSVVGQTVTWDLGTLPGRLDLGASGEISITIRIPVTMPVETWLDNQVQISTSDVETETTGSGLVGSYYQYDKDALGVPPDDPFTNGVLNLRRADPTVDFFWDSASPQPGVIYADYFAARWTGYVYAPQGGTYTFATVTDDGARLWVNGSQLVDDWTQHGMETRSGQVELEAGQWYAVQFDFEEGNGGAGARLQWQLPGDAGLIVIPQRYLSPQAGFMNNQSNLGVLVMPPAKTSDLLLVLDYGGNDTDWFRSYFTNTLDDLAYAYDVWDTELRGPPDADVLNQYTDGVVVWAAPYWGHIIYDSTFTALQSYLDAGGRLFLTSQDTGYYLNAWGNTDFLNNYLHAAYVQGDTDLYTLNGTAGDPIGDGLTLGISGGDGANNQWSTDEIDPISPAVTVFTYDTGATMVSLETEAEPEVSPTGIISSGTAGLRVDTGTYKVVYFSFGFEGINSASDRATVMGRVLAWLQGVQPPVASFTSSSPDWLGQETVFTNTTVVTGPVSYLWNFGDEDTSALESPAHTYAAPGVYTVVLTATNILGSDVVTSTVIIHVPPTVRITPASRNVKPQATHTLTVTVEDALDLGAFEFDLTFDPALLRVDDVTLGDFLESTGRNVGELGPDIDNDTGLVTYAAFSFGSEDGPNGTGTLAIVEFTTYITPGVSALNLLNVQLSDTEAQVQPVQAVGGSVTIVFFGDLDYDGDVDIDDIMIVVAHWNSETGDPDYDSRYDFDADGDIDVLDVMRVAAAWGSTCGGMATARPASATRLSQEGADVHFDPPAVMAQAGVPFTMSVTITGTADLGGFEFDLLFDPDVITVTGVHPGDFLGSSGNNTVALGPRYDENGRLIFGGFGYGEHDGVSGHGSLATLELTLLNDAETILRLEDVQLATSDAESAYLHSVGEGHIRAGVGAHIYLPLVLRSHP